MSDTTTIPWCNATFNPWVGCSPISPGCEHCYAARMWKRLGLAPGERRRTAASTWARVRAWDRKAAGDGTRPRVFCGSLCDWLAPEVPREWRLDLLSLIGSTPHLTWILLTKRPQEFANFGVGESCLLETTCDHVWLGVTVEDQQRADERIPLLLREECAVRFLSVEPMLERIDLRAHFATRRIGWVICGGESGPDARPMQAEWVADLHGQCKAAGVPFFFKQWGRSVNGPLHEHDLWSSDHGEFPREFPRP